VLFRSLAVIVWAAWPSGEPTEENAGEQAAQKSAVSKQLLALEQQPEPGDGGRRTVHGRVVDAKGNPVPGAKVETWREAVLLTTQCAVCNASLIDDNDTETARALMEAMRSGKLSRKVIAETVAGPEGKFEIQSPTGPATLFASTGSQDGWVDLDEEDDEVELKIDPMFINL
jgi:hypothetical protein